MNLFKYFDRLHYLHQLIRKKSTGAPPELAEKLNLSERHTREYIAQMRELGAPIAFDKSRNSYYYTHETTFEFGFKTLAMEEVKQTNGGFCYKITQNILAFL